jgi:hypothetical protein
MIQLGVGDEVSGLLKEQRSAQHARESEQNVAAAGEAIRLAVGTDHFALHAECGGLQRYKWDVFKGSAVESLAKHFAGSSLLSRAD